MTDMFDDIIIKPDPLSEQMEKLLEWLDHDYGWKILPIVILELMKMVRDNPDMPFEDVMYNVSLDWSK